MTFTTNLTSPQNIVVTTAEILQHLCKHNDKVYIDFDSNKEGEITEYDLTEQTEPITWGFEVEENRHIGGGTHKVTMSC